MLLSWCSYPLVLMTVGISIEQQIEGGHEEEGASVSIVCFSGCLRASLLSFISPRPIVILVLGKLSPLFYYIPRLVCTQPSHKLGSILATSERPHPAALRWYKPPSIYPFIQ